MLHSDFVHLHLHTQFSLLDGACRIPELLNLAKQLKMDYEPCGRYLSYIGEAYGEPKETTIFYLKPTI